MQFPNAYKGVKKIFTAEILGLIAGVVAVIMAIAALTAVGAAVAAEEGQDVGSAAVTALGITGFLGIAAAVLAVIAFIFNLIGLNDGSKDEPMFKTALAFVVVGIIASVVSGFNSTVLQNIGQIVSTIAGVLVTLFVIEAIRNLAEKKGDMRVFEKGKTILTLILIVYICALIAKILSSFLVTGTVGAIFGLISAILSVVQYIVYLTYLSNAKKMLET